MSNPRLLPPGFRFHPTDEELILHYLRNQAASVPCPVSIIAEVDIYKFDPWDLPAKAMFGEREWYFFTPRDRKYPNGMRPNRAAASGYWKATGTDKPIHTSKGDRNIGVKKALVFYRGRPPRGQKTNWIMHEYRLAEARNSNSYKSVRIRDSSMRLDDWVLCRIYKKRNHLPPVPPLIDQEQEDSGAPEDNYLSKLTNITQQNPLSLPKSFSISDLLEDYSSFSHVFDNQPEMPGSSGHGSIMGQPSSNQLFVNSSGNNNLVQQLPQAESCVSNAEISLKRERMSDIHSEESNGLLNPLKKRNDPFIYTNFSNQFDTPHCNLLSQPFFSQQILLNSNLGLH